MVRAIARQDGMLLSLSGLKLEKYLMYYMTALQLPRIPKQGNI